MYRLFLVMFASLMLFACGGSDSGSNDNNDNNNNGGMLDEEVETLSVVALETVKSSISADTAPPSLLAAPVVVTEKISALPEETETSTEAGTCGGSVTSTVTSITPDEQGQIYPLEVDANLDYNDYCVDYSPYTIVYNGEVDYEIVYTAEVYEFWYSYDLSYVSNDPLIPSGTFAASEYCISEAGGEIVCSFDSSYDYEGESYSLGGAEVSGDASAGYNVSGNLSDEDGNTYAVTATGLTFCDNGNFGTGSIEVVVNGNEVASVTFDSCDQYTITYLGVSASYTYEE